MTAAALGYLVWSALAMGMFLVWVLSHTSPHGRHNVVRPSVALARRASDPWLRVPLFLGWAWVGWHLFAR